MPFGNRNTTTSTQSQNNSILARTLFNEQQQQQVAASVQQQQQQQQQQQHEILIVQSDTNIDPEEVIHQLQEQFGTSKQIYVLKDEDENAIQYLVADRDADINTILRDSNLFNTSTTSTSTTSTNQQQQQQQLLILNNNDQQTQFIIDNNDHLTHQHQQHQNHQHHSNQQQQQHQKLNKLNQQITSSLSSSTVTTTTTTTTNGSLSNIEESIQRVLAPLPKRKTFEFQLENKKNSYQDAYLRFLAGEKQPTLEIIAEQINRKPKDNTYYNSSSSSNINKAKQQQQQQVINTNTTNTTTTTSSSSTSNTILNTSIINGNNSNTNGNNNNLNDKENYYNSSRRENLLPLNSYEYRNSYKDHYDNQGVRLNPAILKNLPTTPPTSTTTTTTEQQQQSSSIIISSNNLSTGSTNPSIILTGNGTNTSSNDVNSLLNYPSTTTTTTTATQLNDHTYKTKIQESQQQQQQQQTSLNRTRKRAKSSIDSSEDELMKKKLKSQQNEQQLILNYEQSNNNNNNNNSSGNSNGFILDDVTFTPGEFLIHKLTFNDLDNFDIWCVRDDGYLQKYEPVLLSTGERCHQSADVLAQYTPNKQEFIHIKCEEKGKTEQNNLVVSLLDEYEPKNNEYILQQLQLIDNNNDNGITVATSTTTTDIEGATSTVITTNNDNVSGIKSTTTATPIISAAAAVDTVTNSSTTSTTNINEITQLTSYDDLKPTFDVFLQILLSQYLNSEFLLRIQEIQDDYFKPALDIIDTIINEKFLIINDYAKFIDNYKKYLNLKPKILINEINSELKNSLTIKKCQALEETQLEDTIDYIIKLYGQTYNENTLIYNSTIDDNDNDAASSFKEYYLSTKGVKLTQLYHSLKHIKINFYEICSNKIELVKQQLLNDLNNTNSNGASDILNYCLADTQWLSDIFDKFKKILIDFDQTLIQQQQQQQLQNNQQTIVNESDHQQEQQQENVTTTTNTINLINA